VEAVNELLHEAEHRQCARHIYANFKKKFYGAHYEKLFWKASKSTTEAHFNAAMKEIQMLSPAAHNHVMERDPKLGLKLSFKKAELVMQLRMVTQKSLMLPYLKPGRNQLSQCLKKFVCM